MAPITGVSSCAFSCHRINFAIQYRYFPNTIDMLINHVDVPMLRYINIPLCISTGCITIVQVESIKNMRGRVMSYAAMGYFGMLPLGSLLIGGLSQKFGVPYAILSQGFASMLIAGMFFNFLCKGKPEGKPARIND